MLQTGPPHNLPYPEIEIDPPNGAAQIQLLAEEVAARLGFAGRSATATAQSRTDTAYGLLATPDRVQNVILPHDGLLEVFYQALWRDDGGAANPRAAIFLNEEQVKIAENTGAPVTQAAGAFSSGLYRNLHTAGCGLISQDAESAASQITTGQIVGSAGRVGMPWAIEIGGTQRAAGTGAIPANIPLGGPCHIFAAAGTYDVSVRFKAPSGGTVTVKDRKLWVRAIRF